MADHIPTDTTLTPQQEALVKVRLAAYGAAVQGVPVDAVMAEARYAYGLAAAARR